jgi:phage tail tape-measure protein
VTTIIDKFTATNYSASAATISINLVTVSFSAGNQNLITKTKTLQPAEVYTFPEIVGQVLGSGDFISTIAGTATSINIRASGREVS